MKRKYYTLLLLLMSTGLMAQQKMRVVRCEAVSEMGGIQNIFIDAENRKWVANEEEVFEVLDQTLGQRVAVADGKIALYAIPGGNAPLLLDRVQLERILGRPITADNPLTAAFYRPTRKELWLGTLNDGVFQLRADDNQLSLIEQYHSRNSKLKSDQINTIWVDAYGQVWIGTNDGIFFGKDNKWNLEERYFNFTSIGVDLDNRIWLLADDLLGYRNRKGVWTPIDLPEEALDGPIIDFTFDPDGFLWLVSEVVARIDLASMDYVTYGPAQYYTSQFANRIECDLDGGIWVATEDKGLFLIESATAMTVNVLLEKGIDCEQAGNTAALAVRVSGGVAPFTYQWADEMATGANPTGLGVGTYVVTVTDSRGTEKIGKAEITDPRVLAEAVLLEKESGLNEKDGRAEVQINQGLAPFVYEWDNGERTQTAVQLGEGQHQVTITDDNGCQAVASLLVDRVIGDLTAKIQQTGSLKCHGDQTVALRVATAGGKAPFQYQWNTGDAAESIANLGAGTYAVTITDVLGNQTASEWEVTEPEAFTASVEVLTPPSVGSRDGVVFAATKGGQGPFIYEWSNATNRDTVSQLSPGPISVTVTDVSACKATAEAVLEENILELSARVDFTREIKCKGDPAGSFTIVPSGGKGPYQYAWSVNTISGNEAVNQFAGDYTLTLTDAVGQTFVQNITIPEPEVLKSSVTITQPASANGSDGVAAIKAIGGVAPYTYAWNTGATTDVAEELAAGVYAVTITDANGCTNTNRLEMKENILELSAAINVEQPVQCGGAATGILNVEVEGGKAPFTFEWSDQEEGQRRTELSTGAYFVTVTDALDNRTAVRLVLEAPPVLEATVRDLQPASTDQEDGRATIEIQGGTPPYQVAWPSGESGLTALQLAPGNSTVHVTDSIGCATEVMFDLEENVLPLTVSLQLVRPVTCNGDADGALEVLLEGGKGPFTYTWSDPEIGNTAVASELSGGSYEVTVTDAIGQSTSASFELADPEVLLASITRVFPASEVDKADGYGLVEVTGGVSPYQFRWDNGETTPEAVQLTTGAHEVVVTDANGCSSQAVNTLPETLIPGLSVTSIEVDKRILLTNIKFAPDSTNLDKAYFTVMDQLYDFLTYQPGVTIEIGGHTNNLPPDDYCDRVSMARAKSTADYLFRRGIPRIRVFYKGYGKRDPIADNDTLEGRLQNQRVEFKVISIRQVKTGS